VGRRRWKGAADVFAPRYHSFQRTHLLDRRRTATWIARPPTGEIDPQIFTPADLRNIVAHVRGGM